MTIADILIWKTTDGLLLIPMVIGLGHVNKSIGGIAVNAAHIRGVGGSTPLTATKFSLEEA